MDIDNMLENMGMGINLSFNLSSILKIPLVIILLGNVFFAILLFLRVRILSDTFKTVTGKKIKVLVVTYLAIILLGTLLSLLFMIIA